MVLMNDETDSDETQSSEDTQKQMISQKIN